MTWHDKIIVCIVILYLNVKIIQILVFEEESKLEYTFNEMMN